MLRLMVSLPMKDRDDIDIQEEMGFLHRCAERILGEPFELLDTLINDEPIDIPKERWSVWYLGESVKKLAKADLVIFSPKWTTAKGCIVEHAACAFYGIPYVEVPEDTVMVDNAPDGLKVMHEDDDFDTLVDAEIEAGEVDISYDPEDDELEPGEYNIDDEVEDYISEDVDEDTYEE